MLKEGEILLDVVTLKTVLKINQVKERDPDLYQEREMFQDQDVDQDPDTNPDLDLGTNLDREIKRKFRKNLFTLRVRIFSSLLISSSPRKLRVQRDDSTRKKLLHLRRNQFQQTRNLP